jgi:hypothetical protein
VLGADPQCFAESGHRPVQIAGPLQNHAQVKLKGGVLRPEIYRGQERPLGLSMETFLTVGNAQQHLDFRVPAIGGHRPGEVINGPVDISLAQCLDALLTRGGGFDRHSSSWMAQPG